MNSRDPALQRIRAVLEPIDAGIRPRRRLRSSASARCDPPRAGRRRGGRRRSAPADRQVAARGATRQGPERDRQSRQAAFGEHAVEAFVGERQSRGVGDDERRRVARPPASTGTTTSTPIAATPRSRQQPRRGAQAAADVGDRIARPGNRRDRSALRVSARPPGRSGSPAPSRERAASEQASSRAGGAQRITCPPAPARPSAFGRARALRRRRRSRRTDSAAARPESAGRDRTPRPCPSPAARRRRRRRGPRQSGGLRRPARPVMASPPPACDGPRPDAA